MKIGILSDTHGQLQSTLIAFRQLEEAGVEYLIHCGDVCGTEILDALAGTPAAFVYGNNDYDRDELANYAKLLNIKCLGDSGILALDGKRIAVTHGDDHRLLQRMLGPEYPIDYLFTGHSHVRHDKRVGSIRWINPGAIYRSAAKSIATLDLATDELIFISLAAK